MRSVAPLLVLSAGTAVPTASFRFRCRASASLAPPEPGVYSFKFTSVASQVSAPAGQWSPWGNFTSEDGAHAKQPYPSYPILLPTLHTSPSGSPANLTAVDVQTVSADGVTLHGTLYGRRRALCPPPRRPDRDRYHRPMWRSVGSRASFPYPSHLAVQGSDFGIMLSGLDQPNPVFWSVAQYHQWHYFLNFPNASTPPRRYPAIARFIGSSHNLDEWTGGIDAMLRTVPIFLHPSAGTPWATVTTMRCLAPLSRSLTHHLRVSQVAGLTGPQVAPFFFTGVHLPPEAPLGAALAAPKPAPAGLKPFWSGGVYSPPGGAFDFNCGNTSADVAYKLDAWANSTVGAYAAAGFDPAQGAAFAMADEPGWYLPAALGGWPGRTLSAFSEYLQAQGLTPQDVGAPSWQAALPAGRSAAATLPLRRRYYWTLRFLSVYSSQHFAACTAALERHMHPGVLVFANWNNFHGRMWVPGPLGNNRDKASLDAGYGGHDWFDFGRARHASGGTTCLWTEDWFRDGSAAQWSYYAARLRGAASLAPDGGVDFGGYLVGRESDGSPGFVQKALALAGSGAKALRVYTFGPEYMFPGNSYSEHLALFPYITQALDLIGAAEDVFLPGRRPAARIAIVYPRSSFAWDEWGVPHPTAVVDETNGDMAGHTMDYSAEVYGLYSLLQYNNVPADFIDEDAATEASRLAMYRAVLVTEPSVPVECQKALQQYAQGGGTVVLTRRASTLDRYGQPLPPGQGLAPGIDSGMPAGGEPVSSVWSLPAAGNGSWDGGRFQAFGPRTPSSTSHGARVLATFDDGDDALVSVPSGKGYVLRFLWMPGLSWIHSGWVSGASDMLLQVLSNATATVRPVSTNVTNCRLPGGVERGVETPIIVADGSAAVTVLNWCGGNTSLSLSVDLNFTLNKASSCATGKTLQSTQFPNKTVLVSGFE
eukprot:gene3689-685_t